MSLRQAKPILRDTLVGVSKPMLVAIGGIRRRRTLVEFCLCVLEYETDVQVRMLFFNKQMLVPIFD